MGIGPGILSGGSPNLWMLLRGQIISALVTGTGIFSQYLAKYNASVPTFQSWMNYVLCAFYLVPLYLRRSRRNRSKGPELEGMKHCMTPTKLLLYALVALADVEGNFMLVKGYQFSSIASLMVLDCVSIPAVMILSALIFGQKYSGLHISSIMLCILGVLCLLLQDSFFQSHRQSQNHPKAWLGDFLCILGSFIYAFSNVGQEYLVKVFDPTEFLGYLGLFGSLLSFVQVFLFEREALAAVTWDGMVISCMVGYAVCLFLMYTLTSVFMQEGDAALFNLSLLTSDIFALLSGTILFDQPIGVLYGVSFTCIIVGLVAYNREPILRTKSEEEFPLVQKMKDNESVSSRKDKTPCIV